MSDRCQMCDADVSERSSVIVDLGEDRGVYEQGYICSDCWQKDDVDEVALA